MQAICRLWPGVAKKQQLLPFSIYGYPAIFRLQLAVAISRLMLRYANSCVYKKQHIPGFSKENRA